jgi:hypothetical protein
VSDREGTARVDIAREVIERNAMSRPFRPPLALAAMLALALVTIGAAGCAKKLTGVDPSLTPPRFPEGVRGSLQNSPSDLVVWPDSPNLVLVDHADSTIADFVYPKYRARAGASVGTVLDYLGSTGYQMFRRESGGGFRQYSDFTLTAVRRWPDRTYFGTPEGTLVLPPSQLFAFTDPTPPPVAIPGYIGRAVVAGITSATSPLTNLGEVAGGIGLIGGSIFAPDSLVEVQWNPVAGAKGYWLHVYQPRVDIRNSDEAIEIGLAAPVAIGKVRDLFIGYFPAPTTGYKLGDPLPVGARVLVYRVLQGNTTVLIRSSAVNDGGQLIASIGANGDFGGWLEEDTPDGDRVLIFPLGAVVVDIPRRPPQLAGIPAHLGKSATESGVPGLLYYRPAHVGPLRVFP